MSATSAEIILRQGARVLLSSIMRDCRPGNLPDELWPDLPVREEILQHDTWRTRLGALRQWLEDGTIGTQSRRRSAPGIDSPQ